MTDFFMLFGSISVDGEASAAAAILATHGCAPWGAVALVRML
jgi:hypothetical protein